VSISGRRLETEGTEACGSSQNRILVPVSARKFQKPAQKSYRRRACLFYNYDRAAGFLTLLRTIIGNRNSDREIEDGHGVRKRSYTMKQHVMKFVREEDGLTTVEYAIAGGLVGAAVILAFGLLGDQVARIITVIWTALSKIFPAA
jgi:pilus assembly protein Flp/PilA